MAAQPTRRRGSAVPTARKHVMASVRLDVATHARVAAAAALSGLDKSAWMSRAITEALAGIVVFDRRAVKPGDQATCLMREDRKTRPSPVDFPATGPVMMAGCANGRALDDPGRIIEGRQGRAVRCEACIHHSARINRRLSS